MTDRKVMQIEDKSTGKLYPVTIELKQVIADNIIRLVNGGRISGLEFDGKPKKLGLDNKMRFALTPDAGLFQTRRSNLATIEDRSTEYDYYLSEAMAQFIVDNVETLLEGNKVGPVLFEGRELDLSLTGKLQFILTKSE